MDTYGSLKASIASWINRTDLSTEIADFVRLAEAEIYRSLRCRENEFIVTYTDQSAAGEVALLPSNFKEMKLLAWNGTPLGHTSAEVMTYRTAKTLDAEPALFAIVGRTLEISLALDNDPANWTDGDELKMVYYGTESLDSLPVWQTPANPVEDPVSEGTITPLTQTDTNTTRLLQHSPDLYLEGSLYFAYMYLQDAKREALWGAKFNKTLSDLRAESAEAELTGSTLSVGIPYGETHDY